MLRLPLQSWGLETCSRQLDIKRRAVAQASGRMGGWPKPRKVLHLEMFNQSLLEMEGPYETLKQVIVGHRYLDTHSGTDTLSVNGERKGKGFKFPVSST